MQQRFEEMESKINDLRDEVEAIKAEKCLLEKQVQIESEVSYINSFKRYNTIFTAFLKL